MSLKITSYRDFLSLSRKNIMVWDSNKKIFILKKEIPTKELIKGLRFIHSGFNYDLRKPIHANTRRKVEKTLNEYFSLSSRENIKIVSPRKKYRKAVAAMAQQDMQGWKKFYIPLESKNSKIKYKKNKKGRIIAFEKTKVAEYVNVLFEMDNLVRDYENEVESSIKESGINNPEYIKLMAGEHLIGAKYGDTKQVKLDVANFMETYSDKDKNNYFENWLKGVKVVKKFGTGGKNRKKKKLCKKCKKRLAKKNGICDKCRRK